MQKDIEFSISENTFANLLKLKKQMGYENKGWDEWFSNICTPNLEKSKKDEIEKIMEKLHYDQWYDTWVKNFALNLNDIWKEPSARELDPTKNAKSKIGKYSAIVIARGPSIKKNKHLELLAKSNYEGAIVCCDGGLINALNAGVTPDRFPEYYVVTIDAGKSIKDFYNHPCVDKYGKKIKGIFATVAHPLAVERARKAGIKIHWLHALFDYGEGKKSFNQTSALMVRAKNHLTGLPALQTGGNVGTSSWFVSWQILKRSVIALIGIDHSWNENDPWDVIISHGYGHPNKVDFDKNSTTFKRLFPKIYNPEFKCHCILDPIFQYYSSALKEFIARSPSWVNTINATEGGCIFGERVTCMTFANFLQNYNR